MLEPLADERGVGMRIDGRNGPRARCDRRAVQQILINVVGNAIKFGPENGAAVVGFRAGAQVELRVRDAGPGMTPRPIERALQPYARCQVAPSHTPRSTGAPAPPP